MLGFYDKARDVLLTLLPICHDFKNHKNHVLKALVFSSLSEFYSVSGDNNTAQEYALKSIETANLSKNPLILASIMNNIGNLFSSKDHFAESLAIYTRCFEMLQKSSGKKDNNKMSPIIDSFKRALLSTVLLNKLRVLFQITQQHNENYRHGTRSFQPMKNSVAILAKMGIPPPKPYRSTSSDRDDPGTENR